MPGQTIYRSVGENHHGSTNNDSASTPLVCPPPPLACNKTPNPFSK